MGRDDLQGMEWIPDIVCQVLNQVDLSGILGELLFVARSFLKCHLGITLQVGQSGTLLEVRQGIFGASQFLVDDGDTFFDELRRLLCHLVLFVVGILVIDFHQLVDEVYPPLLHFVLHADLGDGRGLRNRFHLHVGTVCAGRVVRVVDKDNQLHRTFPV